MTADRPFVDRGVTDLAAADAAASEAAASWGLAAPQRVRVGMNALYRCDDVVLRVGHTTADPAVAHELVATLGRCGIPVVRPIGGRVATVGDLAISAWEWIEIVDRPVDWEAVGAAVRAVHDLTPADLPPEYPLPSPTVLAWWDFDAVMADVGADLDPAARAGLAAAIERRAGWRDDVAVDPVVCHGDVHPGNVIVAADGIRLTDWDLMCVAHPGWDHAFVLTFAERWGGDRGVYPAFASGYGRSMAVDPVATGFAELRNVAATLMRIRLGVADPAVAAEAERRLRYWRGDPDAPPWTAM